MISKIHTLLLLIASGIALLLALIFFLHPDAIEAQAPLLTKQMLEEYQAQQQQTTQKRQNEAAARKRAELEAKIDLCETNEECIIVDKDPCGCLKGPEYVTTINSNFSLEYSRLMEKRFAATTTCPSIGSSEKECSASARAVCVEKHCKIVY